MHATFGPAALACTLAIQPLLLILPMVTKLLFTALIIVGVLFFFRHQNAGRIQSERQGPTSSKLRWVPAVLLLGLLAAAALGVWLEWREAHRIFTVHIIDTRSGEVRTYPVYRNDVRGRSFTTIDGRVVTLADVERMELVEGVPGER